ncbi:MAG: choice-of-anchor tandem repeat GloVer-containing protein, partial [Gemmataceae bacterium]
SAPLFTWPKPDKDAPLGNEPHGRPVVYQAGKNDILLGMTRKGGKHGFGVVYRYDTSPGLDNPMQVLHDFAGKEQADGATPFHGNLVLVGTSVYGLTCNGGEHDGGVAFVTTHVDDPAKSRTHVLWHFGGKLDKGPDGKNPYGTLLRHGDWYYGTTDNGGANNTGTIFRFRLDTEGTRIAEYQQLASFDAEAGNRTGAHPRDNLTAIGNRLYGMAYSGGNNGKNLHDSYGTIFAAELPEE